MKRTLTAAIPYELPPEARELVSGARIWDSSCSPEARVYYIERKEGFYLKISAPGSLKKEAELTRYFYKKGLGPEVAVYDSGERDILITKRLPGEDCTYADYLSEPKRLCDTIAQRLRELHECDFSGCPVMNRMSDYFDTVCENYKRGQFDPSYFLGAGISKESAYSIALDARSELCSRHLLHGDYCLPNIMLDNWSFSGFIDLGGGGVGDRHIDLFWGSWTLGFNLGTDRWRERFFDAYGRDAVDSELILAVSAAECFG